MLFVQVSDLHVVVHSGVVDSLPISVLAGASFINWFVRGILPMEQRIVPVQSRPTASVSEYTHPSH